MTLKSWFFKLQQEDLKRRLWAIALLFLVCFFALPVGLAITMENAAATDYYRYNDWRPLVNDGTLLKEQFEIMLSHAKLEAAMEHIRFGNGMLVFLLIIAAVVMGISSFSYLHNKKKVDFYHSIPVRREKLFLVQFIDGILLTAGAFGVNLILAVMVASFYGVHGSRVISAALSSFCLNMLYYCLNYSVVVIAVLLTGNTIISLMGTAVFFFFMPAMSLILTHYFSVFFMTAPSSSWISQSPLIWIMERMSPLYANMASLGIDLEKAGFPWMQSLVDGAAFLLLNLAALFLYRFRPSEAAGKAMAFKVSMAPIRILLVLGAGMGGGMFFWSLQSQVKWGIFGVICATLICHCIIEIIYQSDFKKLFSHKIQLVICLTAGCLLFLGFRYDWCGYDSYIPSEDKIASMTVDMALDSGYQEDWSYYVEEEENEYGKRELVLRHRERQEYLEEKGRLTEIKNVLLLVEEGRSKALADREQRLGETLRIKVAMDSAASSIGIIGGADGPTSVFVAGKIGEEEEKREEYYTNMEVCYTLKSGRKVRRRYNLYLSNVLEAYDKLYSQEEYKNGIYAWMQEQKPEDLSMVYYQEGGEKIRYTAGESDEIEALLLAYQADIMELTPEVRRREDPIAALRFVRNDVEALIKQRQNRRESMIARMAQGKDTEAYHVNEDEFRMELLNLTGQWPVYPSFKRTIEVLKQQGVDPGTFFSWENIKKIEMRAENFLEETEEYRISYPEGRELEAIQKENPYYQKDGSLIFEGDEALKIAMEAMADSNLSSLNGFNNATRLPGTQIYWKDGSISDGLFPDVYLTSQLKELFRGLPRTEEIFAGNP